MADIATGPMTDEEYEALRRKRLEAGNVPQDPITKYIVPIVKEIFAPSVRQPQQIDPRAPWRALSPPLSEQIQAAPPIPAEPPTQPIPVEPPKAEVPKEQAKPSTPKQPTRAVAKKETSKPTQATAPTGQATAPIAPLIPPAAPQEPVTPFPEMKYTPKVDTERELSGIIEAMPKDLEDLGGPRPSIRKPGKSFGEWMGELLLLPAYTRAGGEAPYWEQQQLIAERPWHEEIEYQKKRQEVIREYKIKALDYKIKQADEAREAQKKQYAAMGERNPALLENPGYVAGLYPDMPPEFVQTLIRDSIDPKTGQFKPGASLYMGPEARWAYKKKMMAGFLTDMGVTDPKEQAMLIENPDKYWEIMSKQYDSIEKMIVHLRSQPDTPQNRAKIEQLIADKARMEASQKPLEPHLKLGLMINALNAQEAQEKERSIQRYNSNLKIYGKVYGEKEGADRALAELQSDRKYIENQYRSYRDLATRSTSSGLLSAYENRGQKTEDVMANATPEMKVLLRFFPTLSAQFSSKGEIPKEYNDISMVANAASNALNGKIRASVFRNGLRDPYQQMYFDKMWEGMMGMVGEQVIQAAEQKYKNRELIPFKLLFLAAQAVAEGNRDAAVQILLGAK